MTENVIWFSSVGLVEEQDEDENMPWKERNMNYRHFVMKRFVLGCDMYWGSTNEVWKVDICIQNHDEWSLYFKTRSEAINIQNKILDWLIQK